MMRMLDDIKFMKYYFEIANRGKDSGICFITDFQIWAYVIKHISDKEILDVMTDEIYDIMTDEGKVKFFRFAMDGWYQATRATHKKFIRKEMIKNGVSEGEAMIIVDNIFKKNLGYYGTIQYSLYDGYRTLLSEIEKQEAI